MKDESRGSSPLWEMYDQWNAACDAANAFSGGDRAVAQRLYESIVAVEDAISAAPSRTLQCFLIKVIVADDHGDMRGNIGQARLAVEAYSLLGLHDPFAGRRGYDLADANERLAGTSNGLSAPPLEHHPAPTVPGRP